MAKKGNRIMIGLVCTECNFMNYLSQRNKINTTSKIKIKKYCRKCHKHTLHEEKQKLK